MINYLIELSIIHIVMLLGYWFLLRQERQYASMRFYLLGSTCLALILPLLHFPSISLIGQDSVNAIYLEAITIHTLQLKAFQLEALSLTNVADQSYLIAEGLFWIYLAISLVLLFKILRGLLSLVYLKQKSNCQRFGDYQICIQENIRGSFTFFNWIFVSDEIYNQRQNYNIILRHEKAHVFMRHSYDLIFFELFAVCFWWLPTAWIIRKEIKKIHELQADAFVLKFIGAEQYSSLLIHTTLKSHGLSLASSFQDGFILTRLKAMKQGTRNLRPWRLISLMGLGSLLIVFLACGQELDPEVQKIEQQKDRLSIDMGSGEEVFTVVEQLPTYKDGMDAFYQYLRMEMRYPLEARKSGVEGRVDVQFIVEKDGSLSDVKVIKGIGAGCNEEAVRVVQKTPPFNPGKQRGRPVRVRMVIPIIFEIDPDRKNADNSPQGIIIIENASVKKAKLDVTANYADGKWAGMIKDEHGEVLPGASIIIKGTTFGTTSDQDGTFYLEAPRSKEIVISFVGYETIKINGE